MTVRLGETHQALGDLPQQLTFVRHARGLVSFLHTSELLPLLKVQTLIPTTNNKQNSIPNTNQTRQNIQQTKKKRTMVRYIMKPNTKKINMNKENYPLFDHL